MNISRMTKAQLIALVQQQASELDTLRHRVSQMSNDRRCAPLVGRPRSWAEAAAAACAEAKATGRAVKVVL